MTYQRPRICPHLRAVSSPERLDVRHVRLRRSGCEPARIYGHLHGRLLWNAGGLWEPCGR